MKGICFNSTEIDNEEIKNYQGKDNVNYGCSMRGAWRALQCMKDDVAIVIHGPKGCNNEFKLDYTKGLARTYCTNMTEQDVITGGIDKLEKLIMELNENENISIIVILTTCTSELIGEDIDGLVSSLNKKIAKKCIVLHTSGISGMVQSEGHNMVITQLAKNFMKKKDLIPNSINYIGYSWPWDEREGRDISELRKILDEIGIKLNAVLTSNLGYNDIQEASKASLNVVRCPGSAYTTIDFMEKELGIPYLKLPIPVGIKNSSEFFYKLIDYFKLPEESKKIINNYEKFTIDRISKIKPYLEGKKVAIAVGANRTIYLLEALLELGLDVKVVSFYRIHETIGDPLIELTGNTFKKLSKVIEKNNLNLDVLVYNDTKQFMEVIRKNNIDIVFDVHTNRKTIHSMGLAFSESMDVVQPYQFYYGFLALAYDLVKELNQPFYKNYKEYC